MKLQVINFDGVASGEVELDDLVFGILPRKDSISDVVRWQLAKRQQGTHAVKGRSDVRITGKKIYKQKGTGNARHGAKSANIFVGGGVVFGPVVRSHAFKLNKKLRNLALKSILSLKVKENNIIIVDDFNISSGKTKILNEKFQNLGVKSALFVDSSEKIESFCNAIANLPYMDLLPEVGLNVYDCLRHDKLILTKNSVSKIQERLLG